MVMDVGIVLFIEYIVLVVVFFWFWLWWGECFMWCSIFGVGIVFVGFVFMFDIVIGV